MREAVARDAAGRRARWPGAGAAHQGAVLAGLALSLAAAACSRSADGSAGGSSSAAHGVVGAREGEPWPRLSDYGLFEPPLAALRPRPGVLPYDVNTELFSDGAIKRRFVWLPPGTAARYHEREAFAFPVGAILVKAFGFPEGGHTRWIETRLLVHTEAGWRGLPYVWDEAQSNAELRLGGATRAVSLAATMRAAELHPELDAELDPELDAGAQATDAAGPVFDYFIPNANMCAHCHNEPGFTAPLGVKARHLNLERDYGSLGGGVENQLARWRREGILQGGPPPERAPRAARADDPRSGTLEQRARAWLDINCASCHSPRGRAASSGMYLGADVSDPLQLGVLKPPTSAGKGTGGRKYGIVPGEPDASILLYRIESSAPGVAMPEIGRQLVPRAGAELIRAWIAELR